MPLKKTVAMERRIDLASLFCVIARHGPAVLLTLAGIGCVVAGFIFFKRVRNKRRRRAAVAERRGSSAGSRDEALGGGSTDVSDESSLDDAGEHVSMSHGQVRQRRAASERKLHKHNAPDKDAAIDKAQHSFFWEWNSHRTQSYTEEAVNNLDNRGYNEEYVDMLTKDVGNQKHKRPEADSSDDITTSNEDVSEGYFRCEDSALDKQEETVRRTYNSQSCFCPTSSFKVDDRKETNSQPLDSTPGSNTSSVSVKENHSTALQKDHVTLDQANDINVGQCISRSLNNDKRADEPGCDELKEELVAFPKSETEPSTLEETKDVHFKTSETTHITNVSPEGQESASPESQKLEAPIDQSGHYPPEQSHHSTEVQSDKDVSSCPKDIEKESLGENINRSIHTEVISHSLNISTAVGGSAVKLETAENVEIETILPDDACLQDQPRPKDSSQAQKTYADNLSDQNDALETLPTCKENLSNDGVKVESIDSRQVDGFAQPESIPNPIPELFLEETSPSDVPADVKVEIQSTTESTTSCNSQKADAITQHLETETSLCHGLCNESTQADQGADTDTLEMPTATINNKIDCIVEQIVADAYIEVRQKTMHMEDARPEQLCVQPAQDSDCIQANVDPPGIDKDVVKVCTQGSKEVVFCSNMAAQITEEVVNAVRSLEVDKEKILESGNQKDLTNGASDSFSHINVESIDVPTVTADPLVQNINGFEEKTQGPQETFNVSIPSAETSLNERPVVDVKSVQIDETVSVDLVPDKDSIDNDFAKDPISKAVELENCSFDVDVGKTSTDLCQVAIAVNDVEKVEREYLTETKTENVENLATSGGPNQCEASEMATDNEQSKVEVVNPADNRSELKVCDRAEVLEITSRQAQTEEPAMSADSHNGVSSHIEKTGCKVVIVCRTLESSVSAVELSDDEDVDCISSRLELNSNSQCHNRNEDKRTSADDEFSVVTSSDTVAANEQTEDTSTHTNKRSDLTSVALDFGRDEGAAMKPAEKTKRETCVSSHSLESGIYSMTVSPETEEASEEVGKPVGDLEADLNMFQEEKVTHSNEVCTATDEVTTVQRPDLQFEYEDISDESLVTNEDSFGSEIEDGYQEAMENTMLEVVQNITSVSVDTTQVEVKSVDNVKKHAGAVNKEEKADSEKTDISIMEATMDHNEWIIDGSYQMLPWMTATSSSISNKDGQGSVEIEPPPQASITDDSADNAKKVLAVQPMPQNVNVTFRVHYLPLSSDQTVAVTGDQQELGAWKAVVPLEKSEDGFWSCVVGLPVDSHVEWKFVVLEKGEVCRWEECGNRLLFTGCGEEMLVYKWWGIL
ncbi:unnamed protein product [Knipowitschia caucasica]